MTHGTSVHSLCMVIWVIFCHFSLGAQLTDNYTNENVPSEENEVFNGTGEEVSQENNSERMCKA